MERVVEVDDRDALIALGYLAHREVEKGDEHKVGVTHHSPQAYPGLNLYADRVHGEAYLIDLRGERVHTWASEVAQPSSDDPYLSSFMFGWQHVEPAADGSLLAIVSRRALLKLSWNSELEWVVDLPVHHDVAIAPSGQIVTLSARPRLVRVAGRPGRVILDDDITFIDPKGEVAKELSLYELFFAQEELRELLVDELDRKFAKLERHGLHGLIEKRDQMSDWSPEELREVAGILRSGESPLGPRAATTLLRKIPGKPSDVFHTNTVEVLSQDAPGLWGEGDLLISMRNLDLIAVVSEDPPELRWWWGRGELSKQHQPTLLANGNLLIHDNGVAKKQSRILELDPGTRSIVWEWSTPFYNATRGGSEKLANGNILVTDSGRGHVFELDENKELVWDFWNPVLVDDKEKLRRRTIYRMSRLESGFFAQSREP